MNSRFHHALTGLFLCGLGLSLSATAAQVWVRLVDADRHTPLEFLENATAQDATKTTLHRRMPSQVYVDGKAVPYGRYGKEGGGDDSADKVAGMADLEKDLGAGGADEAKIRSERASQVLGGTGVKAQVTIETGDGEHTLLPGGLKFTVANAGVAQVTGVLTKVGPGGMNLPCRPVDINFGRNVGVPVPVKVLSGGQPVFQEILTGTGTQALRLFLPVSALAYTLRVPDLPEVAFYVEAQGVRVAPAVAGVDVRGSTLAFMLPPGPAGAVKPPAVFGPELYLFIDRNRAVFAEGESVQISVRAYGPATGGDQVTLSLTPAGGKAQALAAQPLTRTGGTAAAELELQTALLRPALYELQATWGETRSNPLPLNIVSLLPATNFKLLGYSKWNTNAIKPAELEDAVRNGLNLVSVESNAFGRKSAPAYGWNPVDWPLDQERLKPWQKANFPSELLELAVPEDQGAEYLLANGIENVPITCPLILYFNVGPYWQHHADDRYLAIQHFGQQWRRFPNFSGMIHTTGDGPTPATMGMVWAAPAGAFDIIHEERMKKLREVFEFKVGKIKIDDTQVKGEFDRISSQMQGAIGFGVGMSTQATVEGPDAVKLEWCKWVNDLYPANFREERKALGAMMANPIVNCGTTWGQGAGGGMWPETFYRPLDNPIIDIHGDFGIIPLSYSTGSDLLSVGRKSRPWEALDLIKERPLANGLKIFLEGFSRNPAGIGSISAGGLISGPWGGSKESAESMSILMDIGRRFGDLLPELERQDEIAIVASLRQAALADQSFGMLYGAHFLATKAGYQPNFITEETCIGEAAALARFKAVFLVSMTTALPAELTAALVKFQGQGGLIIADAATKTELPNVIRVKVIELNGSNEVNFRKVYGDFEPLIKEFQAALLPKLKPFFTASRPHVHLVRSADQDLEYWTLFNDTLQSPEECGGGHFVQFLYKGLEVDLRAERGGVLYDALRRQLVPAKGDKSQEWHADLMHLPGTVYLNATRPIASLAVTAPRQVEPGTVLRISAQALDEAGKPFAGRLPLEIVVTDPTGAQRYRVWRTTNREVLFKLAGNDPLGDWHWTVTDQATGLTAAGAFSVAGTALPAAVTAVTDLVYDATAIYGALHQREFDVALFPDQEALRPAAADLAAKLTAAGSKARVRTIWPSEFRVYPMNWKEWTVEDEELHASVLAGATLGFRVPGKNQHGTSKTSDKGDMAFYKQYASTAPLVYHRDVILLGRGDLPGNPMLDVIARHNRLLPRNLSANFPAPGYGLLAYAWGPFHYGHDAIVAYGRDAQGLERAIASLTALAAAKSAPKAPYEVRFRKHAQEDGQVYTELGLALAKGNAGDAPVIGKTRVTESVLPETYQYKVEAAQLDKGRLSARIRHNSDTKAAPFVSVDLASGNAKRFNSEDKEVRAAEVDVFARDAGSPLWSAPLLRRLADGSRILPLGRGLARIDAKNATTWFFDPFPVSLTYEEGKYPRRCQQFILTPDEKFILALFYDHNAGGGYGPSYLIFNQGATVLLDAQTGKEVCRYAGWLGGPLAMADDASRCLIGDNVEIDPAGGRQQWNPTGAFALAAFDRAGKELWHLPGTGYEAIITSRDGSLAAVTYTDARKYVSLFETANGKEARIPYGRMDVGTAVAPDGAFAVIAYADGMVRKLKRNGAVLWEKKIPAPGIPVISADGTVIVCGNDARLYFPDSPRAPISFAAAPVENITAAVEKAPPGLLPPAHPFWRNLDEGLKPEPLPAPANAASLANFDGDRPLTVELPKLGALDVVLLTFDYRLRDPKATLTVSFEGSKDQRVSYAYPYALDSRPASVPLRATRGAGPVALTFAAPGGASITNVQLLQLNLDAYSNLAYNDIQKKSANTNTPRLIIPVVHGYFRPGEDWYAYGWPAKGSPQLPPDLAKSAPPKSDVFQLFNGDIYDGTPLYPAARPNCAAWNPKATLSTMQSAHIYMEFTKPVTVEAFGVWEHPFELPVSSYSLEYLPVGVKQETETWLPAADGRYNRDYFHCQKFAEPITAKRWRYTLIDTPSCIQRVAEIELYSSAVDALDTGEPATKPGGKSGGAKGPDLDGL